MRVKEIKKETRKCGQTGAQGQNFKDATVILDCTLLYMTKLSTVNSECLRKYRNKTVMNSFPTGSHDCFHWGKLQQDDKGFYCFIFIYFCTHASTHYIYSNIHILHLICFTIFKCLFSCNTNRGASAVLLFALLTKATKRFNQFPLATFVHKRTAFRLRLSSSSRSSPVHVTELTWNMG